MDATFKMDVLILAAQSYEITDEKTNQLKKGISLLYLPSASLAPFVNDVAENYGQLSRGYKPAKATLPIDKKAHCHEFPGLYEATMTLKVAGEKQQAQAKMLDLKFLNTVNIIAS